MSDPSDPKPDPREKPSAGDEERPVVADFQRHNVDLPLNVPPAARDDCFGPPETPIECFCLHCGHIYMSDLLLAINVDGTTHYACPVKDCDGLGYKFDIFPVNEEDNDDGGWVECDDDVFEDEDDDPSFAADDSDFTEAIDPNGEIPFDPPQDWSPESDTEDAEAIEEEDDEPRYFTRDDYDALKASGEYDRRAEEIRTWWRQCQSDRKDPSSSPFGDDDIPF